MADAETLTPQALFFITQIGGEFREPNGAAHILVSHSDGRRKVFGDFRIAFADLLDDSAGRTMEIFVVPIVEGKIVKRRFVLRRVFESLRDMRTTVEADGDTRDLEVIAIES